MIANPSEVERQGVGALGQGWLQKAQRIHLRTYVGHSLQHERTHGEVVIRIPAVCDPGRGEAREGRRGGDPRQVPTRDAGRTRDDHLKRSTGVAGADDSAVATGPTGAGVDAATAPAIAVMTTPATLVAFAAPAAPVSAVAHAIRLGEGPVSIKPVRAATPDYDLLRLRWGSTRPIPDGDHHGEEGGERPGQHPPTRSLTSHALAVGRVATARRFSPSRASRHWTASTVARRVVRPPDGSTWISTPP